MVRKFSVNPRNLRGVAIVVPVLVAMTLALPGCGGDGPSEPQSLGVVTDLSATAVDAFQVDLTWSAARGASSYRVHRSTEDGFSPSLATRIADPLAASTTEFSDKGVVENTAYYYKVVANKDDEYTFSNQTTVTTPAPQPETLVADAFDRTVNPGWGTADVGGTWTKADRGPMRVDGSVGVIQAVDSVPQLNVLEAPSTYGRYVDGKIRFSVDKVPDAGFHTVGFYARRDDDDGTTGQNHYRFNVMLHHDNLLDLRVEKEVDGVNDFVTDVVHTALTFEPGVWYWARWVATGTQPTSLRLRVWRDGDPEPGTWDIDIEHNEPALDVRGTTGVRANASGIGGSFPFEFSFDDLMFEGD